jgi:sulfatase maturation enzyme AslB (radical SAM superfamily)
MKSLFEKEDQDNGIQTVRVVADVIDGCNLNCQYCHPNSEGWSKNYLSSKQISNIFQAAEDQSMLEVTLTGGEIMIHPEFAQIMEDTHMLDRTTVSFITNATNVTPQIVNEIEASNVGRICVSIDGPDAVSHDSMRGKNFSIAMEGLRSLQDADKPVAVISVVHKQNYEKMLELLSRMLANERLADQHHICAASYSGAAKNTWDKFALDERTDDVCFVGSRNGRQRGYR